MDSSSSMGGISGIVIIVIYIAIFALLMYFIAIRPQRKQQKKQDALLASIEVGDSILPYSDAKSCHCSSRKSKQRRIKKRRISGAF